MLTVIRELGVGGFGRVELVRDSAGMDFARKTFIVTPNFPASLIDNVRRRFTREARTQSGIAHRNIVPVVPTGLNADPPWYLMPVAESTLQDDLSKDKLLGGHFLTAITDIVAALDEMHRMQLFHRDLKPQNVLRFADPTVPHGFRYAVSDFGLVAMTESRLSSLTTTGMAKGADFYTAPEITADLRLATAQSDVYSLGCIIHEMIGQRSRVPCAEIIEQGDYAAILRSCTRTDPKRRFPTVRAVLEAVLAVASGLPTPTTTEAASFTDKLDANEPLDPNAWKALVEYVEDHAGSDNANAILLRLRNDQIAALCATNAELASRLAIVYAEWILRNDFGFERCDFLANNLEVFITACAFEAKVDCLMAMLRLGTSHNRWYVESMFMRLCDARMDVTLARRLAVEFRASGDTVCKHIAHVEQSITASRANLHPVLVEVLQQICR